MLLYLADLLQHPLHYPVIPICIAPRLQVEDRMEDEGVGVSLHLRSVETLLGHLIQKFDRVV